MAKQRCRTASSSQDKVSSELLCQPPTYSSHNETSSEPLIATQVTNPVLFNTTPEHPRTRQQKMRILMEEQYLTFINEKYTYTHISKNDFITSKICLEDALLPEEDVEGIELSVVTGEKTNNHALLLHVTHDINRTDESSDKVSFFLAPHIFIQGCVKMGHNNVQNLYNYHIF